MKLRFHIAAAFAAAAFCVAPGSLAVASEASPAELRPRQTVLTWQDNPSSSMTITWRTNALGEAHTMRYRTGGAKVGEWITHIAHSYSFEESPAWLHTVKLDGLEPDTVYHVVIDHPTQPDEFSFRTIPAERGVRELTFLAGGDSRTRREVRREINAMAAAFDPDFVVFTGDFIDAALSEREWDEWFDDWAEQLITSEGHRVPVVPAIGNHEVYGAMLQPKEHAPYYYNRFNVPEPENYYALPFAEDLVIITLDSAHTMPIPDQNEWLEETLTKHADRKWKLVQYHVAAWPSVRDFEGTYPRQIRQHWVPLFEEHGVSLVLEAHDHAFKKTVPIFDGQEDAERGIVYIGDGGWGAPVRPVKDPEDYWWLADARTVDNFWVITLSADGEELDYYPVFGFQMDVDIHPVVGEKGAEAPEETEYEITWTVWNPYDEAATIVLSAGAPFDVEKEFVIPGDARETHAIPVSCAPDVLTMASEVKVDFTLSVADLPEFKLRRTTSISRDYGFDVSMDIHPAITEETLGNPGKVDYTLEYRIANPYDQTAEVSVTVGEPYGLSETVTIPANGSERISHAIGYERSQIPLDHTVDAKFEIAVGNLPAFTVEREGRLTSVWRAAALPDAFAVDGDLSKWEGVEPYVYASGDFVNLKEKWSPEDLSAKMYLGYHDSDLYVAFEVTDDVHHNTQSGGAIWNGDSVQLGFDFRYSRRAAYDSRGLELGFSLDNKGQKHIHAWYSQFTQRPRIEDATEFVIVREGTTTVYEIKIPLEALGDAAILERDWYGFTFAVNDHDGTSFTGGITGSHGMYGDKNPSLFGTLILEPAAGR